MSDHSCDTTFDQMNIEANRHFICSSAAIDKRLKGKKAINLCADTRSYNMDNMRYNKTIKMKLESLKFKKASKGSIKNKALAEAEFKLMCARYKQDDLFVRKGELEEYVDDYYKNIKEEVAPPPNKHSKHLKLMYNTLFPDDLTYNDKKDDKYDSDNEENVVYLDQHDISVDQKDTKITEINEIDENPNSSSQNHNVSKSNTFDMPKFFITATENPNSIQSNQNMRKKIEEILKDTPYGEIVTMHDIKKKLKGKIVFRDFAKENDLMMEMLKNLGNITLKGKTADTLLNRIKSQTQITNKKMNFVWQRSNQKLEDFEKEYNNQQRKLLKIKSKDVVRKNMHENQPHKSYRKHLKREWLTATQLQESVKLKEDLLKHLQKENQAYADAAALEKEKKLQEISLINRPRTTNFRNSHRTLTSEKSMSNKSEKVNNQIKSHKQIIHVTPKNSHPIKPRTVDFSLTIGACGMLKSPMCRTAKNIEKCGPIIYYASPTLTADTIESMCSTVFKGKQPIKTPNAKVYKENSRNMKMNSMKFNTENGPLMINTKNTRDTNTNTTNNK